MTAMRIIGFPGSVPDHEAVPALGSCAGQELATVSVAAVARYDIGDLASV
jgi:hypothetical protein